MKGCFLFLAAMAAAVPLHPEPVLKLQGGSSPKLKWEATLPPVVGAQGTYTLQSSSDLALWEPTGVSVFATDSGHFEQPLSLLKQAEFFRVLATVSFAEAAEPGAEVQGLSATFKRNLAALGEISLEEFAARYPQRADYLPGIDWDPTTARFWTEFNTDPVAHNATLPTYDDPERRSFDFRLNESELALLKQNGFVVTDRLGTTSFGELLYRLYNDDLPLFLSTDCILQAWHRSYANMLLELEQTWFYPEWREILDQVAARVPALFDASKNTSLEASVLDCDFYLAVARSLGAGTNVSSSLGQDARVQQTLDDIASLAMGEVEMFGRCRRLDYSQFKPRGYYTANETLQRYFRMLMWLGRLDFRITPGGEDLDCNATDPAREFRTAALLTFLLQQAGAVERWAQMNSVIQVFVGSADSLNFLQLQQLLQTARIENIEQLADDAALERLNNLLLEGNFGVQEIMSDMYVAPNGKIPRSFLVFGQRFVPDSWALVRVVYDNIRWQGESVKRFLPAGMDLGFSLFANNTLVPFITADIKAKAEILPLPYYQHNLAAARITLDQQEPAFWQQSIYFRWLDAIRSLSTPTTDPLFPQVMRTRAWALKTANTQFASWTELKHDTVLYAKQGYSAIFICSYPRVFVEPMIEFWQKMKAMALYSAEAIENLSVPDRDILVNDQPVKSADIKTNQVKFLRLFADRMQTLGDIASAQLNGAPLTDAQHEFLQDVVEIQRVYDGLQFSGWLPNLFYRNVYHRRLPNWNFHVNHGISRSDALVTDVHTDAHYQRVLHQATGRVRFALVAVERGSEKILYGGPLFSHYELVTENAQRLTDDEWETRLRATANPPPPPPWTSDWLAPFP